MASYKDAENPNCRIGGGIFPTKLLAQEANMLSQDKLVDIVYLNGRKKCLQPEH